METCYQVNYQTSFGGGEVFTRAVCRALAALDRPQVLFVHQDATFWDGLGLAGVERVPIGTVEEIDARLPARGAQVLTHNLPDAATAARWGARHHLAGFLHMPLWERDPAGLEAYRLLLPVSAFVADSARARLDTLCRTHDGFEVAEEDLLLRGAGELLGYRQTGPFGFRIANPRRHYEWLLAARDVAAHLLESNDAEAGDYRRAPRQSWRVRMRLARAG